MVLRQGGLIAAALLDYSTTEQMNAAIASAVGAIHLLGHYTSAQTDAAITAALVPVALNTKSAVQVDAEAETGAAQVNHVALVVSEPEAQVAQRDGASHVDQVIVWVSVSMMWPTPCLQTILAMMSWPSGPTVSAALARLLQRKVHLRVRLHLHKGQKTFLLPPSLTKLGPSR